MVWALRNSGHSLLIVDGEEKGKHGAKYLRYSYPKLFNQLNRHKFMVEMDWAGTGGCLYNQVDNSELSRRIFLRKQDLQIVRKKGDVICRSSAGIFVE